MASPGGEGAGGQPPVAGLRNFYYLVKQLHNWCRDHREATEVPWPVVARFIRRNFGGVVFFDRVLATFRRCFGLRAGQAPFPTRSVSDKPKFSTVLPPMKLSTLP